MKRLCGMLFLLATFGILPGTAQELLPATLYEEWRISPAPANGSVALTNPPSLQWRSLKHWENRDVRYRVELSNDSAFLTEKTIRGELQRYCFFNPHSKLDSGTWYWRYEIHEGNEHIVMGPYNFKIEDNTPVFESPAFPRVLENIPKAHPRFVTQGKTLAEVQASAKTHPLAKGIIEKGKKFIRSEIYDGPLSDSNPARQRNLERTASREVGVFHALLDAFILTNDGAMLEVILKRLDVLLRWPTDDLLGSQVLTALAKAHDAMGDDLPESMRKRVLNAMDKQIKYGLAKWPGKIEGRQVENHFWQMELAGNFTAALSTVGELESSREMLEYTYELFIARFPNLSTPEGGWSEGLGYFGVNESAVVDMAVLLKKVCKVDVFKMEWYQSLADYFIYFSPIGGRMDGFGDMHDRVGNGDIGHAMMLVLAEENSDPKAKYRLASLLKNSSGKPADEPWEHELQVEPWYQIINSVKFNPNKVESPQNLPQSRLFRGVGLAAFHTDALNSPRDTAVYFRSSPFGAKGHMHANQNAFNLSRGGEPLFYSTGYYTSFADAHSLGSYRHTRAHNAILVNGCGQAFGHEGYGWIKRYIHGNQISYVCGDATMAYRQTVDKQFLELLNESGIDPKPANGYGDSKLKLFERHLVMLRPDVVVIYDVLESEVPSDWTYLLHTMKRPRFNTNGDLQLVTEKNFASAFVTGSQKLQHEITNQFYALPMDFKKKYRETPDQFHIRWSSTSKTTGIRFLSIIQLADAGKGVELIEKSGDVLKIGDLRIQAELDPSKEARLSIENASSKLFINELPERVFGQPVPKLEKPGTLLAEVKAGKATLTVDQNMDPKR